MTKTTRRQPARHRAPPEPALSCAPETPAPALLHVFAGHPRAGSFADAAEPYGVPVVSIDLWIGGLKHDVRDAEVRAAIISAVREGKYDTVWIGTPCASFSVLWLADAGTQPPRAREAPDGVEGLPGWLQRYVALHNSFVAFTEELAMAAWEASATFIIENPVDYGLHGSRYYQWAKRHHCPLWLSTPMQRLAKATSPTWVTGCQCELGGDFRKATTLMAAGPRAHRLLSFAQLQCTHATHARVAYGRRSDGQFNSADAAAYPVEMCTWAIETLFTEAEAGVSAVGFAALPRVVEQRAAAKALDARNAAAAAEALAEGGALDGLQCMACDDEHPGDATPPFSWRSAPEHMPAGWAEAADAHERLAAVRSNALSFIARRRAEAEDMEVLAKRPFDDPSPPVAKAAVVSEPVGKWPVGAPPRPIRIDQLYYPGVYAEIRGEIAGHSADISGAMAAGRPIPKRATRIWRAEKCQPPWARGIVWDCEDPLDCKPVRPFSEADPPKDSIDREFFRRWGEHLPWADADMLQQVIRTGVEGRSDLELATVIMGHHGGLRHNWQPALDSITNDTAAGWMTPARLDLRSVPARLVPKNVAIQRKWTIGRWRELLRKLKYRVTTDDSIEPVEGEVSVDSRNVAIDRSHWGGAALPGPRTLAEAVAIIKSISIDMGWRASHAVLEQVALWALDLSNAYRELAVARTEQWQQCFVWAGGVKLDLRCVFGAAHMVDFFQRVSTFVLAVARERIRQYDGAFPYSASREAWRAHRAHLGAHGDDAAFASIYLDDGSGAVPLAVGESLRGRAPSQTELVRAHVAVDPGGRVRLSLFNDMSRAQAHLQIVRDTFREAGWDIAEDKVQLGFDIDLLGVAVSSEGSGRMYVPEAKRRGMVAEMTEILAAPNGTVDRSDVEAVTGRCSHIAIVVSEGNAYLQPLYRMQNARRVVGGVRLKPRRLAVIGKSSSQQQFARALEWWCAALEADVSTPLAPRSTFPALGDDGCAYFFTDAARENGTGYGAHATIVVGARVFFLFREQRWPADALAALQADRFSMPAGECFGAVSFADVLLKVLTHVTHLVCYTDSDATARAFSAAGSGAPQLNCLMQWLMQRHPGVQLLGVHQPGERNRAADALSRSAEMREVVLREAAADGLELLELQTSQSDSAAELALLAAAMACPLRR